MESKRVALATGVVGLVGLVAQYVPSRLVNQWIRTGPGGGHLPTFGTTAQTVVTYNLLAGAVGSIATVLLAVWVGHRLGDRLDLPAEYRQFGGAVAAGALASALVGLVAMWFTDGLPSAGPVEAHVLITLAVFVRLVAMVSLVVAVGVFAGAALSHFRADEGTPSRPTGLDHSTESDHPTETDADGRVSSSRTNS